MAFSLSLSLSRAGRPGFSRKRENCLRNSAALVKLSRIISTRSLASSLARWLARRLASSLVGKLASLAGPAHRNTQPSLNLLAPQRRQLCAPFWGPN